MTVQQKQAPPPKSHDVQRFLDSLPVAEPKPIADLITEDHSEQDSPSVKIFFAGMTWVTAGAVLGAVAYLTWLMFTEF